MYDDVGWWCGVTRLQRVFCGGSAPSAHAGVWWPHVMLVLCRGGPWCSVSASLSTSSACVVEPVPKVLWSIVQQATPPNVHPSCWRILPVWQLVTISWHLL